MTGTNPDISMLNENGDEAAIEESSTTEQPEGDQPQTSEVEGVFNKLPGSTQDRVRKLWQKNKETEAELEQARQALLARSYTQPEVTAPASTPDLDKAKQVIKSLNFTTSEDVDARINNIIRQQEYRRNMEVLEKEFSGKDGRPQFSKDEYEGFVRTNPKYQYYDPKDVYGIMYQDELDDWKVKTAGKSSTGSLKSGKSGLNTVDEWTPEYIEEKLKGANGPAFYDKNKDKIEQVLRGMH